MKKFHWLAALFLFGFLITQPLLAIAAPAAELPPGLQIPDAARPGPDFDVDKATEAYLNLLTPEQTVKGVGSSQW